jgi:hypothetical protein
MGPVSVWMLSNLTASQRLAADHNGRVVNPPRWLFCHAAAADDGRKKGLRAAAGKPDLVLLVTAWYCVFVVGRAGFEPATNGLKVRCSTS